MEKVKVVSPEEMSQAQGQEDVSMTPLERLEIAFSLSDFAFEVQRGREVCR